MLVELDLWGLERADGRKRGEGALCHLEVTSSSSSARCSALKSVSAVERRGRMAGGGGSREPQCREDCRAAVQKTQDKKDPSSGYKGEQHKRETSPQAKRHRPSLLFTSLTMLFFINR